MRAHIKGSVMNFSSSEVWEQTPWELIDKADTTLNELRYMSLMKNLEISSIDNFSDICFIRGRERDKVGEKGLERFLDFFFFLHFIEFS